MHWHKIGNRKYQDDGKVSLSSHIRVSQDKCFIGTVDESEIINDKFCGTVSLHTSSSAGIHDVNMWFVKNFKTSSWDFTLSKWKGFQTSTFWRKLDIYNLPLMANWKGLNALLRAGSEFKSLWERKLVLKACIMENKCEMGNSLLGNRGGWEIVMGDKSDINKHFDCSTKMASFKSVEVSWTTEIHLFSVQWDLGTVSSLGTTQHKEHVDKLEYKKEK